MTNAARTAAGLNDLTARQVLNKAATEDELKQAVLKGLAVHGWLRCHFRPARTEKGWRTALEGDKGLPDVIAARRGEVLFIELKRENGKLSDEQEAWRSALLDPRRMHVSHRYFTLKPSQLDGFLELIR